MTIRKLFLCHFNGDADEVRQLATQLKLRGIVPWVDKDGGFKIGDHSPSEARRAIREDCFGLLFYATKEAFTREFIRDVEIDEALKVRETDPNFLLFAVPRRMTFEDLKGTSIAEFGADLSPYHAVSIPRGSVLTARFQRLAVEVLEKSLRRASKSSRAYVSLQFSTRDLLPDAPEDILRIDARDALPVGKLGPDDLLSALRDVKAKVAEVLGRPRIRLHGSKHLSAAFSFGRVFAPFEVDVRQTPSEVWTTDAEPGNLPHLAVSLEEGSVAGPLFVEVVARLKNVAAAVDGFIERTDMQPAARLQIRPLGEPLDLDNALCRSLVCEVYKEIEKIIGKRRTNELHLFVAAPQAFMVMLGREFKGMPPTFVYDWSGTEYELGYSDPGGVL